MRRVVIGGDAYAPAVVTVARGDSVFFVNGDTVPRNATATDGSFDTGRLAPGAGVEVTLDRAGSLEYFCRFRPTCRGTITTA